MGSSGFFIYSIIDLQELWSVRDVGEIHSHFNISGPTQSKRSVINLRKPATRNIVYRYDTRPSVVMALMFLSALLAPLTLPQVHLY